jgi:PAS domain S-box-containing protein
MVHSAHEGWLTSAFSHDCRGIALNPAAVLLKGEIRLSLIGWVLAFLTLGLWIIVACVTMFGDASARDMLEELSPAHSHPWIGAGLLTIVLAALLAYDIQCQRYRGTADLLGQILEEAPFMIQIKDANLRYVWFNKAHLESRPNEKVSRENIVGKTVEQAGFDPELAARVNAHDREVMASGVAGEPREQVFQPPGEDDIFVALVSKVPLRTKGRISHIVTVSADTGQWRAAQIRNEEARRLLELVMDAAPITIQVIDRDMRFRWANRSYRRLFEASDMPLIGQTIHDVERSQHISAATQAINEDIFATEKPLVQVEQYLPATDTKAEVHLLVTKVPVRDLEGRVWGILTMGTDVTALKQAQARADVADSLVAGLLRHAPMGIQVKDADLRIRWANESFATAVNARLEDVIGKTLSELNLPAAGVARTNEMDRKVLEGGESFQFDERWTKPNGELYFVRTIKGPLRDADGRPTHVITLGVDVTEQAQITAALRELTDKLERRVADRTNELREANELVNTVIESAPMLIGVYHLDNTVRIWNPEAERVTGYTITEALEGLTTRQSPEVRATLQRMLIAARRGQSLPPADMTVRRKDGTFVQLLAASAPLVGADGQIRGMVNSWLDVSDLRAAEADRHRLFEVFDKAGVALAITDVGPAETVSRLANAAAFRIFKITPEDFRIMHRRHFVAEKDAARVSAMIEIADREGYVSFETTLTRGDGTEFAGFVSITSLPPADDKPLRRIITVIDITKQHLIEEQLRQSQKMEAVGQLTGGIAHDFNNLLTTILGNSELLELQAEGLRDPARASIRRIREAGERAASLIRQMLAFSRKQSLRPEIVDANLMISGMSEILRRTLGENIAVSVRLADDLRPVLIDPNQLESAVLNLAINARDAMPGGGVLSITTRNAWLDEAAAAESGMPSGGCVMLTVSDTGTGMTDEAKEHAFEPFFTTKPVGKGTGLGLSQVYGFVKQSGGHVALSSTEGLGTIVTICLPHHQPDVSEPAPVNRTLACPPVSGGETILVVEDQEDVSEYSRAALSRLGYRTLAAGNAAEALKLLEQTPEIALLFSDIGLPGMGGIALAREARRRRPDLRVLLTTGHAGGAGREAEDDAEPIFPLDKPFTILSLAQRVRQALDGA